MRIIGIAREFEHLLHRLVETDLRAHGLIQSKVVCMSNEIDAIAPIHAGVRGVRMVESIARNLIGVMMPT